MFCVECTSHIILDVVVDDRCGCGGVADWSNWSGGSGRRVSGVDLYRSGCPVDDRTACPADGRVAKVKKAMFAVRHFIAVRLNLDLHRLVGGGR